MSEVHYTFREEYVRCSRGGCNKCPHGPYRYAYWRENGKLRKKYLGKVDPPKLDVPVEPPRPHPERPDPPCMP